MMKYGRQRVGLVVMATDTAARGFTLIELLVTIGIIGLLVAVTLPAVQNAREASRKIDCAIRMKQVAMAVQQYHDTHRVYPSASFKFMVLPELGYPEIYNARLPLATTPLGHAYDNIRYATVPPYLCPSDSAGRAIRGSANISGSFGSGTLNYGFNGFFNHPDFRHDLWPGQWIRDRDIQNGHSNVAMLSEMLIGIGNPDLILRTHYATPDSYAPGQLDELCDFCGRIPESPTSFGYSGISSERGTSWLDPSFGHSLYNHAIGPNRPSCMNQNHLPTGVFSATSQHIGGINVAYADGHVSFVSNSIDREVWRRLGARGNQIVAN